MAQTATFVLVTLGVMAMSFAIAGWRRRRARARDKRPQMVRRAGARTVADASDTAVSRCARRGTSIGHLRLMEVGPRCESADSGQVLACRSRSSWWASAIDPRSAESWSTCSEVSEPRISASCSSASCWSRPRVALPAGVSQSSWLRRSADPRLRSRSPWVSSESMRETTRLGAVPI